MRVRVNVSLVARASRQLIALTVCVAGAISTPQIASAQSPSLPKPDTQFPHGSALDAELIRIEQERKGMFSKDNPQTRGPVNSSLGFPNVAVPVANNDIDILSIARRYETAAQSLGSGDDLLVFASFSMPTESLKRLVVSVSKVGGSVVMRGFKNNSYRETVAAIAALGEGQAHVSIHPKAFSQYKISAVPAFVLAKLDIAEKLDEDGCSLPENYAAIAGDVSLEYALSEISKRSSTMSALASRYLRGLQSLGGAR